MKQASAPQVIDICLPKSPFWHRIQKVSLSENMRLADSCEASWQTFLLSVGEATIEHDENGFISLPFNTIKVDDIHEMISSVFGAIISNNILQRKCYFSTKEQTC